MDWQSQVFAILNKYGSTITPEALQQARGELNALGIHIQNEDRGDYRPRLFFPDGGTVDLGDWGGSWQWVDRGGWGTSSGTGGTGETGGDGTGAVSSTIGDAGGTGQSLVPGSGGTQADYSGMLKALRGTPGYQFAFNEGLQGIQRSAAARGTLLTGGTLKALEKYGTGLADQTYGEAVNRYQNLAELGARVATAPY